MKILVLSALIVVTAFSLWQAPYCSGAQEHDQPKAHKPAKGNTDDHFLQHNEDDQSDDYLHCNNPAHHHDEELEAYSYITISGKQKELQSRIFPVFLLALLLGVGRYYLARRTLSRNLKEKESE